MKEDLLKQIIKHYFESRDFNGFFMDGSQPTGLRVAATQLVEDGRVQVVAEADFPNPHIRPWLSKRTVEQQVDSINSLQSEGYGLCLYPTPEALRKVRSPRRFVGQPFRQAMAKGKGDLELAYFSFDVLEQYRNDPRYHFSYWDFGVDMSIGNEAYLDGEEPEKDKVSLGHIGFAYDLSKFDGDDPSSPIVRRVAAFYGDLAKLSPEHQQRWKTYEVPGDNLEPHPAWWMSQMGHFPDGIGPFEKLFLELENINELFQGIFNVDLFSTTDRPKRLGWILRPSQREWDEFVSQLDKVLSENMQHSALTVAGAPTKDENNGQNLGSVSRLAGFMLANRLPEEGVRQVLKPIRDVRTARQKPAHKLRANINDKTFVHKQITLLGNINESLTLIRKWLASHPANQAWKPKYKDIDKSYRM